MLFNDLAIDLPVLWLKAAITFRYPLIIGNCLPFFSVFFALFLVMWQ
jgi:hypothetical protein